jgi:hypothetical protein
MYLYFSRLLEAGQKLMWDAYGGNYERLVALKDDYDSDELLRLNHDIEPTG